MASPEPRDPSRSQAPSSASSRLLQRRQDEWGNAAPLRSCSSAWYPQDISEEAELLRYQRRRSLPLSALPPRPFLQTGWSGSLGRRRLSVEREAAPRALAACNAVTPWPSPRQPTRYLLRRVSQTRGSSNVSEIARGGRSARATRTTSPWSASSSSRSPNAPSRSGT